MIALGPNIRFVSKEYWDFWDHALPLSDRSMAEGLQTVGFEVVSTRARTIPYTMSRVRPLPIFFLEAYLRLPLAWHVLGQQFLVVAQKPTR